MVDQLPAEVVNTAVDEDMLSNESSAKQEDLSTVRVIGCQINLLKRKA